VQDEIAVEHGVTGILHGRVPDVIDRITRLVGQHPPSGTEQAKIIGRTLHYLAAKQPYLDYPAALANGWPIATGVIEGTCRHLPVNDRMGITGARWSTSGAQVILWLRAIHANTDQDTYWNYRPVLFAVQHRNAVCRHTLRPWHIRSGATFRATSGRPPGPQQ
jgi:hypothetical protein